MLIWNKTNGLPVINNHYLIDKEYIFFIRAKGLPFRCVSYELGKTIFRYPVNLKDKKKYRHPTIKPLPIIETLIRNSSKEGDVVLDPFMGSGTTAVAAQNLNRKYIGYELNDKYCKVADVRLKEQKLF